MVPVTTGGINHSMKRVPHLFTRKPMMTSIAPAAKMPASADGMPPCCLAMITGEMKAKLLPR